MPVRSVAVLSLHTSPVAQPGVGDGGGMNIYVRSLASALARAGVACDVYTRAEHPGQPRVVTVEPNFRVINVPAGPLAPVPKESLPGLVDEFTEAMLGQIRGCGRDYEVLHANYWLSGQVAHRLKHELSLPMVATFHTLALVKGNGASGAEVSGPGPGRDRHHPLRRPHPRLHPRRGRPARLPLRRRSRPHRGAAPGGRPPALLPGRPGGGPGPARPSRPSGCCCSWAGSSRSRASTWPCGRWPRSTTPSCGRWAARAAPTGPGSWSGSRSWPPTSAWRTAC